tara:strand:+ start:11 stop:1126 length:1116 start_codon:yes stop_codon:yes gene_type:complete
MSTRTTRSKTKHLEAEKKHLEAEKKNELKIAKEKIDKVLQELSSSKKYNVNRIFRKQQKKQKTKYAKKEKAAIAIQTQKRRQNTRKQFQANKPKLLKEYFKKLQLRYKNLQELPLPILNKIVNNIFEKLELGDDEAKNLLVISITTFGICNNFNEILNNLLTLNKKILQDVKKLLDNIKGLIRANNINIYPSSDSDDTTQDNMQDQMNYYREKMDKIYEKFNILIIFRDKMLVELKKILIILKKDDSTDSKLFEEFIKEIDVNWKHELLGLQGMSIQEFNEVIDDYEEKITTKTTIKLILLLKPIKESFYNLLNNTLIYTHNVRIQKNIITPINDALKISKSEYEKYLEYFKPTSKKTTRRLSQELPPRSY